MKIIITFDIYILILILIFSFILETYNLTNNPAGFFADEASIGFDAYSLIKSGVDRKGEFPLFFKGFNYDNVSPYHVYLTIPFIAILGLNEVAVRITPVFFSLIELVFFYLLLQIFIPKPFALIGTFLLSISPWHFHLSRVNFGDFYSWVLLTIIAYYFFVRAFNSKKRNLFIFSAIFFSLATYSYTPARLITPLVFSFSLILIIFKKYFKMAALTAFVYVLVLVPFIYFHITDPNGFQRIKDTMGVDIKNQKTISKVNSDFPTHFLEKYFLHYSDDFLFKKGDADFPGQFIRRHSISGLGLLYAYQKLLIITGLIWLTIKLLKTKRYELLFVIFLFLIFPLADSLTTEIVPFATRSYLGILPFHILIAFGIYGIYQFFLALNILKRNYINFLVFTSCLLIAISSLFILINNFNYNPKTTSDFWGWQYGPRDIMKYFLSVQETYDDLYMSGEFNGAEIFPKFYDPENSCQNKCKIGDFYREPQVVDFYRRQLFSLSPEYLSNSNFNHGFKVLKTIYYPDGKVAFVIGEIVRQIF